MAVPLDAAALADARTTVLYVLSTLAQTCAALAAFVGAVGLFHLQLLRERHAVLEREMRGWGEWLTGQECQRTPLEDVLNRIGRAEANPERDRAQHVAPFREARRRWEAFPQRLTAARRALGVFEGWNLLVIVVSLAGFNHVSALAAWRWTLPALWPVALVTVGVTGYCVLVWTRE